MSPSGMCKEEELDKDIELDNRVASMLERRSTPVSSRFACYFSPRTSFLTFAWRSSSSVDEATLYRSSGTVYIHPHKSCPNFL